MTTKAVRIHGKMDLRLEEFELPEIKDDEILARIVCDSICMSSYKAALQGASHKRVPDDIAENPTIIGHEFCGELISVGEKWAHKYKSGDKFVIQPALNYKGTLDAPGYSYKYIGGDATYVVIPNEVMLMDCLLPYSGEAMYDGALAEPLSCVIGAFHASFHTVRGSYEHDMGIRPGGKMAILAGVGPMGLAAIDYIIHCERHPSLLVATDIDERRLSRAEKILTALEAAKNGVELVYLNTKDVDASKALRDLAGGGYDDVFVFAPVSSLVETADSILAVDGCLNFFAGPSDSSFKAPFNFYNVHYSSTHIIGTSGGNVDDMRESIEMTEKGLLTPAILVTHIGGLDAVAETTLNLPKIPGGKKLIYTGISLPLTAIDDFERLGETQPLFAELHRICASTNGLWNPEAEKYLLSNGQKI